jgi:hypothetical protein
MSEFPHPCIFCPWKNTEIHLYILSIQNTKIYHLYIQMPFIYYMIISFIQHTKFHPYLFHQRLYSSKFHLARYHSSVTKPRPNQETTHKNSLCECGILHIFPMSLIFPYEWKNSLCSVWYTEYHRELW